MNLFLRQEPVIEKDPTIDKMRLDVFKAMENIIDTSFPKNLNKPETSEIRFISFEDALRELVAMKQTS